MTLTEEKNKFIDDCHQIYRNDEVNKIEEAYQFGLKKHGNKKRLNGDDYMMHPLCVAEILLDLNVDSTTIESALIHETINHANATHEEIETLFGSDVAHIVETISKLNKLELNDDTEYSIMNLRKVLVGMSEDVRVLFIKLADRLQNLRTADALDPVALKKKVYETMTVLIPIAHRLGMYQIKGEMEDFCLKYSKPDVYHDILERLNASYEELKGSLEEMEESISEMLLSQNIPFKIKSRVKSVYSIYNKLNNGKKWENIYDILALRVIVEKVSDCYLTIGLIHAKYRPIPGRFKDYIAMPKANMYQSLHTGVFGSDGHRYEIQVRTEEMDEFAEKGVASHFAYKEKKFVKNMMEQRLEIFRNLIESTNSLSDVEFKNDIESDLLKESIYVFTPKGDVLELPKGSTPLDFAYRIHSDVGNKTVQAIVNDASVPLNYELKDNDIIKIRTNPNGTPSKEWLTIVKTSHARNKIKAYFSKQDKDIYTEKGHSILLSEIRKRKLSIDEVLSSDHIKKICKDLKLVDLDDIYFSIGSLRYTGSYIINLTMEDKANVQDVYMEHILKDTNKSKSESSNSIVLVDGKDHILVNLAHCCHPVFGDDIVGYVTKGEGVSVHRTNCPNIEGKMDRAISVSWNINNQNTYLALVVVNTNEKKNHILDLISKATAKNIYIDSFKTKENDEYLDYELIAKVKNKEELDSFMDSLKSYRFVLEVKRVESSRTSSKRC